VWRVATDRNRACSFLGALVREAMVDGRMIVAGPDAPEVARCPACGSEVRKRKRRTMDKTTSWFYRHPNGAGKGCPKRYKFGS